MSIPTDLSKATSPEATRVSLPVSPPAATAVTDRRRPALRGLLWALVSCLSFGASGTLAKGLMVVGWSPLATVWVRVAGAALLMGLPALLVMRHRLPVLRRYAGLIVAYGLVAVACTQLFYFLAVQTLPVAVALLIEYLAPIIVIGWLWLRHGQRPGPLTVLGVVLAVAGLSLVLGITGAVPVDLAGLAWALGAAVSLAVYFVLSARPAPELPPLVLIGCGMIVGALTLGAIGLTGVLPFTWSAEPVALGPWTVSPVLPLALLVLVSAVLAYTSGLFAVRLLGSRVASFVGLAEVLAAVGYAWVLLGEFPTILQLAGGVAILLGATAVKAGEAPAR